LSFGTCLERSGNALWQLIKCRMTSTSCKILIAASRHVLVENLVTLANIGINRKNKYPNFEECVEEAPI
jgi:hypothetical protein